MLIVNEDNETVVNLEQTVRSSEPNSNPVADNESSEIMIMEEEMAVDLSIASKNSNAEGKYLCFMQ